MSLIGQSLRRMEDARFLTGRARYVADRRVPGEVALVVVRSPHAHAEVGAIATEAARAAPGVLGVFTAEHLVGVGPIPCGTLVATVGPMMVPAHDVLARGRVRHGGAPVAFVVAETLPQALDAAELVDVAYAPLPCVTGAVDALAEGAPLLWEEAPDNLAFRFEKGDAQATEAALAGAAHVVEMELVNNRLIVAPLEHRGCVAAFEAGVFALELSGQGVHGIRADLAAMFGVGPDGIEVRAPDVGGGFGVKNGVYPEYAMALWAARHFGRAVRWDSSHGEDFVSSAHARDNVSRARLGVDSGGRFLALAVETVANMGSAMASGGPGTSTNSTARAMGGGYDIPAVWMAVRGAFTNTVPLDAYRGAGKPEANYLMERLVDAAAARLGMDRVELRRRNLVAAFPHATAVGTVIDGGRFAANIDPALTLADAAGFAGRRAEAASRGMLRGLGVTSFLETARGAPGEGAELRFGVEGRVSLRVGSQSNGQGHETSFPQVAAGLLGLEVGDFDYVQADTRLVRDGNGHGGARSLHMAGQAMVEAADAAIGRGRVIAGRLLQASAAEIVFAVDQAGAGVFRAEERSVSVREVMRAEPGGMDSYAWTPLDLITFPNGMHIAEVEVDPETGHVALLRYAGVDDFGNVVNPMLLEGQVQGGLAQGIGQALMERVVHDDAGQLVTGSYMDYAVPRASDLPWLKVRFEGVPTTANRLGVKGAGQAGAIAAPQAVVAAVLDALAAVGVQHVDMPLTPERVWRAMRAARGQVDVATERDRRG